MPLTPQDEELSKAISRPGRIPAASLRTVLVARLSTTLKAVGRRSLRFRPGRRSTAYGIFCEGCQEWRHVDGKGQLPGHWYCPTCKAEYRMEFAIYEKVDENHRRDTFARTSGDSV
jgi:hypothetical protein